MHAKSRAESKGLKLHVLDVRSDVATTLERTLDVTSFTIENTPKRFGRLHPSIVYARNQRTFTGWVLRHWLDIARTLVL